MLYKKVNLKLLELILINGKYLQIFGSLYLHIPACDPCAILAAKFLCVNNTPFGRPVVPEEYGIIAMESGSISGNSAL